MAFITTYKSAMEYMATLPLHDMPENLPSVITQHGVEQESYARVSSIDGGKTGMLATVTFWDKEKQLLLGVKKYRFTPLLNSDKNFIAQAYDYLKTLPEFASAQDC